MLKEGVHTLPVETVELIKEIDRPNIETINENISLICNHNEQDVTGYVVDGQGYYFKRFRSYNQKPYVFNSVTGQVTDISEIEWKMFDYFPLYDENQWVERCGEEARNEEIRRSYQKLQHFLQPMQTDRFQLADLHDHGHAIDKFTPFVLLINTTEQCNIRCTYCYFSGHYDQTRVHQPIKSQFSQIKPIIDKFMANHHLFGKANRGIYFFGGEPLLNFELIEDVTLYIKQMAVERNLDISNLIFQIATNGLLLNQKIADKLVEFGIHMNVSMDGPNHDLYRIDALGKGTADKVTAKLEWLCENYNDYYRYYVGINCVVSPPYNMTELYNFFVNWKPAQECLHLDLDLILPGNESVDIFKETQSLNQAKQDLWQLFINTHEMTLEEKHQSWIYFFTTGFNFLHRSFSRVLWRATSQVQDGKAENLLGTRTLPGLFITVLGAEGTMYGSYEYQSEIFEIGSVENGYDSDKIYQIANNFRQANNEGACGNCWAARMCQVTYPDFYVSHTDDSDTVRRKLKMKASRCANERFDLANSLATIETIKENYGVAALDYMEQDLERLRITFGVSDDES